MGDPVCVKSENHFLVDCITRFCVNRRYEHS